MNRIEFDDDVEEILIADLKGGVEDDAFSEFVPAVTPALEFGDFILVGHGEVTNYKCGSFRSHKGCLRVELHNRVKMVKVYDRDKKRDRFVSVVNKGYIRKVFHSCDKPSCPVCYKFGWAGRQARRVEVRLKEASKRFGQVEHIIATVPPSFYGLSFEVLRERIKKALFDRGVVGGFAIFHGFRYHLYKFWYWSPHFHVLGFIRGGYKCRGCAKCRRDCGGFVNRTYECYKKDKIIVKVRGKRKTVRGTARYLLDHSCIRKGVKRSHAGVWFGVCGCRKLKILAEDKSKPVCPICGHELVRLRNFGGDEFDGHEAFVRVFDECGLPLWVEDMERGYRG